MKSQVNALLHVLLGVCKDVQAAYPALKGFEKDTSRLPLLCRTRGLGLFTLDLPNLDALLLRGLEDGRLSLSGPLTQSVSPRIRVPKFLSGLWLRVFDKSACLKEDVDATAVFFLRQIFCLGKRIEVVCSNRRREAALETYHGIERSLRMPTLGWSDDRLVHRVGIADNSLEQAIASGKHLPLFPLEMQEEKEMSPRTNRTRLQRLQQVADIVVGSMKFFEPVSLSAELEEESLGIGFRHGPGAVSERFNQSEKFDFKNWPNKLDDWFPFEFCGKTAGSPKERPLNNEKSSRLILVPKTAKSPRIIAAEPAAHQWCQQLIRSYFVMETKSNPLLGYFVNFARQDLSGDLVVRASRDRKLATVDLSDASDRLSCWTVERVFRSNPSVLHALHAARTRLLRDSVSKHPGFLKLRKFASQGTAVTFPVQSVVFLCIALAASMQHGKITPRRILSLRNKVRVYGDDIILPSTGYEEILVLLDLLQLKANKAKCYVSGHFRESCGSDAFLGVDVTPVKPKTVLPDGPASRQAVVDTINNLFVKGLWNASHSLESLLPPRVQRGLRIVGPGDAGLVGLRSYCGSDESHLKQRWNSRLHRYESRVWGLRPRTRKSRTEGFEGLLAFFARKHCPSNARDSEHIELRGARDGLSWEPMCASSLVHA
ncbi:RNA-directed RNA polymerase [ssRNA phage Gerhypos.1_27]|uniref:RNA-directed RNA polymerase n=2 Tax=Leviviricetes TaxID=2842243 RepID=A0A8S5L1P2_9VIRU|nr:RNA-directed RNA polymerase [ssRNA phage Gerhypos.1_27]QDH91475.1 MAG: RNA-dependent RNA polymerase [Leviviridae sp.]DAD51782.1 TPA_asm: RNA-directed RNA polymerase [ssRNA phage Gerhypos.1_27]